MDVKDSIQKTKHGFEAAFSSDEYYNRQTRDDEHLSRILSLLSITEGMKILDLGTGTGYLALALADKYPKAEIVGLDIVEKALEADRKKAALSGLDNVDFLSYDGIKLPFADGTFDMVVTRYALHHFPQINDAFREISRVLTADGALFLSDPAPNDEDSGGFIDEYMQMKKDGHIKFRSKQEWFDIADAAGLDFDCGFESEICFPRKRENSAEYPEIAARYDSSIINGYKVTQTDAELWITVKVNNLLFKKHNI